MPVISRRDGSIYYALSGREDGDLLVLSNSLGSNLSMWNKVLAPLEAENRVLRYDTRGHGGSSISPSPFTLDDLGRDVLSLLNEIGARSVNFCGLSLGGLIGMWLGMHAPQRLNRLILANTAARIGSPEMWDERVTAVRRSGMEALAASTPARWFTANYRETHIAEMKQIEAMIASTSPDGYLACCAVLRDSDLRPSISSIAIPSLVIGGAHDSATPPSEGRALTAILPHAQYVELDSSHLSAWERPDEFGNAVLSFLAT